MRFIRLNDLIKWHFIKQQSGDRVAWISEVLMLAVMLLAPAAILAQVSSNEINYFSRCRDISEVMARAACYDDLYDRAVRAITPRDDPDRLMDENRRMREELARIRQRTGSPPATSQSQEFGSRRSNPTTSEADEFGRRGSNPVTNKAEEFGKQEPYVVKDDEGKEALIGRIVSLDKSQTGWIVTLEHGQVWRQMVSKRYELREGQEVRIYPTMWGNAYRLTALDSAGFIQVERIQ